MSIGPIQIVAFGFERTDQFRGEVLEELANLRGRGLIRLVDLFLAIKDMTGDIVVAEMNDLTEEETVEFGRVIGKLLGLDGVETGELSADAGVAAYNQSKCLGDINISDLAINRQPIHPDSELSSPIRKPTGRS